MKAVALCNSVISHTHFIAGTRVVVPPLPQAIMLSQEVCDIPKASFMEMCFRPTVSFHLLEVFFCVWNKNTYEVENDVICALIFINLY
jgi:hypothetical protein